MCLSSSAEPAGMHPELFRARPDGGSRSPARSLPKLGFLRAAGLAPARGSLQRILIAIEPQIDASLGDLIGQLRFQLHGPLGQFSAKWASRATTSSAATICQKAASPFGDPGRPGQAAPPGMHFDVLAQAQFVGHTAPRYEIVDLPLAQLPQSSDRPYRPLADPQACYRLASAPQHT